MTPTVPRIMTNPASEYAGHCAELFNCRLESYTVDGKHNLAAYTAKFSEILEEMDRLSNEKQIELVPPEQYLVQLYLLGLGEAFSDFRVQCNTAMTGMGWQFFSDFHWKRVVHYVEEYEKERTSAKLATRARGQPTVDNAGTNAASASKAPPVSNAPNTAQIGNGIARKENVRKGLQQPPASHSTEDHYMSGALAPQSVNTPSTTTSQQPTRASMNGSARRNDATVAHLTSRPIPAPRDPPALSRLSGIAPHTAPQALLNGVSHNRVVPYSDNPMSKVNPPTRNNDALASGSNATQLGGPLPRDMDNHHPSVPDRWRPEDSLPGDRNEEIRYFFGGKPSAREGQNEPTERILPRSIRAPSVQPWRKPLTVPTRPELYYNPVIPCGYCARPGHGRSQCPVLRDDNVAARAFQRSQANAPTNSNVQHAELRIHCNRCGSNKHHVEQCTRPRPCRHCGKFNHLPEECFQKYPCAVCGKLGHATARCKTDPSEYRPPPIKIESPEPHPKSKAAEAELYDSAPKKKRHTDGSSHSQKTKRKKKRHEPTNGDEDPA